MAYSKAVLFDLDGVLVDACELHYSALNAALATHQVTISRAEHIKTFNGLPTRKKLEILTKEGRLSADVHDQVAKDKQRITEIMIRDLKPDNEKIKLLEALKNANRSIAVCSNSVIQSVGAMLTATGLIGYVDILLGNDMTANPKPDPEIFLSAAFQLGVPIKRCVIVEDSPIGLKAAYAAEAGKVVPVTGCSQVNMSLLGKLLYI